MNLNLLNIILVCCLLASEVASNEPLDINEMIDDTLKTELPKCKDIDPMKTADISTTITMLKVTIVNGSLTGIRQSSRCGDCFLTPKGDAYEIKLFVCNKISVHTGLMSAGPVSKLPITTTINNLKLEVLMSYNPGDKPKVTGVKIVSMKSMTMKSNTKGPFGSIVTKVLKLANTFMKKKMLSIVQTIVQNVMENLMGKIQMPV